MKINFEQLQKVNITCPTCPHLLKKNNNNKFTRGTYLGFYNIGRVQVNFMTCPYLPLVVMVNDSYFNIIDVMKSKIIPISLRASDIDNTLGSDKHVILKN